MAIGQFIGLKKRPCRCLSQRHAYFVGLALAQTVMPSHAIDTGPGVFSFSSGFDFSSGDYGDTEDTDIWYVPFLFRYEWFPLTARLTVPYLEITGPGGVVVGDGRPLVVGPTSGPRTTETGVGDVVASIMYSFEPPPTSLVPFIDLTLKVKFPTADESRGLGTGSYDYIFQGDVSESFGMLTPLAAFGYKLKGDAPGVPLDNVFFASGGLAYKFTDQLTSGAFVDWQENAAARADDALELSPYFTWKFNPTWSFTGYGVVGFTDGSPDEGGGVQIKYTP